MRLLVILFAISFSFGNYNILGSPYLNASFVASYLLAIFGFRYLYIQKFNLYTLEVLSFLILTITIFISADRGYYDNPFSPYSVPRQLLISFLVFILFSFIASKYRLEAFDWWIKGLIIGLIIALIFMITGVGLNLRSGGTRISLFGMNPNTMALLYSFGIATLLFKKNISLKIFSKFRYTRLIFILLFGYVVIGTGSRTGLLVLGFILALFFIRLRMGVLNRIFFLVFGLLTFVALGNYILNHTNVGARITEDTSGPNAVEADNRSHIWGMAVNHLIDRQEWIFGSGVDGWDYYIVVETDYRGIPKGIHNTYLSLLVYSGLLGLGAYLWVFFRIGLLSLKPLYVVCDLFIIRVFFGIVLIYSFLHDVYLNLGLWSLAGITFGYRSLHLKHSL